MFLSPLENRLPSFGSGKEHLAGKSSVWLCRPRERGRQEKGCLHPSSWFCNWVFGISGLCKGRGLSLCCCSVCRAVRFLSARKKLDPFPICSSSLSLWMNRMMSPQVPRLLVSIHVSSGSGSKAGARPVWNPVLWVFRVSISLSAAILKAALAITRGAVVPFFLKQTSSFWNYHDLHYRDLINQIWKIRHPQLTPHADTVSVIFSMPVDVFCFQVCNHLP